MYLKFYWSVLSEKITIRFGVNKRQNYSKLMAAVYLGASVQWILTKIPPDSVFAVVFFHQKHISDQAWAQFRLIRDLLNPACR